ncbi:MAG: NAD(P)-binding oxidoreductase [bacterium]
MDKMLVVGASGATGRLLTQILLQKKNKVIAIVRNKNSLSHLISGHPNLQVVEAEVSNLSVSDLAPMLKECSSVLSCLGHNLTFKGLFGHPRRLVTDTIEKITLAIESNDLESVTKIILMNTNGNSNRDIPEKPPFSQRLVVGILRLVLPPHVDNEKAADYLRLNVNNKHKNIEWAAVRPDSLMDEDHVTPFDVYPSPIRNAIFDSVPTSRINVAEFMSELACDNELWSKWKGKMPVIYNHA